MKKDGAQVIAWQRLEGLVIAVTALLLYRSYDTHSTNWWPLVIFFLVPDISMAGYLINKRLGAFCYNAAHNLAFPLILMLLVAPFNSRTLLLVAVIWLTHIGVDRALGYGLKYNDDFKHTHLGKIGRAKDTN